MNLEERHLAKLNGEPLRLLNPTSFGQSSLSPRFIGESEEEDPREKRGRRRAGEHEDMEAVVVLVVKTLFSGDSMGIEWCRIQRLKILFSFGRPFVAPFVPSLGTPCDSGVSLCCPIYYQNHE